MMLPPAPALAILMKDNMALIHFLLASKNWAVSMLRCSQIHPPYFRFISSLATKCLPSSVFSKLINGSTMTEFSRAAMTARPTKASPFAIRSIRVRMIRVKRARPPNTSAIPARIGCEELVN
ncbi:hypothetical protein D3C78_1581430 [compost metagenome]